MSEPTSGKKGAADPLPAAPRSRRAALLAWAGAAVAPFGARPALGQGTTAAPWPSQPVRYINPYPAGGPTDTLSRLWCARMSALTGQQFVVDNRSGSAGNVGATVIARAAPDGYTIGLGGIATHAIAPTLYAALPFDPAKDFTFLSGLWRLPNLLVINNDLPARSVPELIALLRANPGRYSYGSAGSGTTIHLSGELFKKLAGVDVIHVPYRGTAPAMVDLIAGRIHMIFDNIPTALAQAREGKVRPLAVTTAQRSPVVPDIPTMAEFLPGYEMTSWTCVCGPAGLPAPVVARISALARQALESEDLRRAFAGHGATAWWTSPEDIAAHRAAEQERLAPLIRAIGARVD
ncbi:Bug family tripartite tricarboxylate transporter substrate binding protein [Caldovatus aquaticus]|uniref:Tripartite tricarboxylate transporter substrate binding protein n=1 Tax=Caldovatus aquaticus TaxID=2865671 RepID=A0ABS7EXJ8_9PROT|nr:tripartite tricarboxylate transporter substrate binding protein [Caldovatus aquaticus]MBW8268080.1 tripartite tricarboxylate transporter substrate binding protein [Caldovatus aquaticus]